MEKLATLFQENIGGKKKTCNYELGWFRMEGLEADIFCLLRGNQYCPDCSVDICDAQCLCWWEVQIAPLCDWVIIVSIRMVAAGSCSSPVVSSVQNIINIRWRMPGCHLAQYIVQPTCLVSHDNQPGQPWWWFCLLYPGSTLAVPWQHHQQWQGAHHQVPCRKPLEQNDVVLSPDWHLIREEV